VDVQRDISINLFYLPLGYWWKEYEFGYDAAKYKMKL